MTKQKKIDLPPIIDKETLKVFLKSPAGIVLSNWALQGMRYMNLKEKGLRILSELVLFWVLTIAFPQTSWFFLILFTHTIFWLLFGHLFVLLRYVRPVPLTREKLINFLDDYGKRVKEEDSILAAAAFGSISRGEFSPTSDLDVRLVSKPGFKNYFKTFWFCMFSRTRAVVKAFPLDIYIFDKSDFDTKVSDKEPAIVFYDPKGFFKNFKSGTVDSEAIRVVLKYPSGSSGEGE